MAAPSVLQTASRDSAGTMSLSHAANLQAIVCPNSCNNWWGWGSSVVYEGASVPTLHKFYTGSNNPIDAQCQLDVLADLSGTSAPADSLVVGASGGEWKFKGMAIGHDEPLVIVDHGNTGYVSTGGNPFGVTMDPGNVDCLAIAMSISHPSHDEFYWGAMPGATKHWSLDYQRYDLTVMSMPVLAGSGPTLVGYLPAESWLTGWVAAVLLGPVGGASKKRGRPIFIMPGV